MLAVSVVLATYWSHDRSQWCAARRSESASADHRRALFGRHSLHSCQALVLRAVALLLACRALGNDAQAVVDVVGGNVVKPDSRPAGNARHAAVMALRLRCYILAELWLELAPM